MGSVNLVVIVESVRALITKEQGHFHLPSIIGVAAALGMTSVRVSILFFTSAFTNRR